MTHKIYPQWPRLCDYHDRPQIQTHWPLGQADQWSLAPMINIRIWLPGDEPHRHVEWGMGQALWSANKNGWKYKKTTWVAAGREIVLDLWFTTTEREGYWEFRIDGWIWTPDYEPLAHGTMKQKYAGEHQTNDAVWTQRQSFHMDFWYGGEPRTTIQVGPSPPNVAWPEVPVRLGN